jgi:hypothetical protein
VPLDVRSTMEMNELTSPERNERNRDWTCFILEVRLECWQKHKGDGSFAAEFRRVSY